MNSFSSNMLPNPSFDVLREPWIPIIFSDGTPSETGILECLEKAHKLREIRSPAPIIEFGLYRLLVAFVLDVLIMEDKWPEDVFDLKDLIQEKRFDMEMIQKYIDLCGDVFDLFHPEKPFLQTKMDDSKPKAIAGVFPATPSGSNANFWHHQHENEMSVPAAEAARMLTTIAPFMTAGGAGLCPSINGAPALYALPLGENLFETILLNVPSEAEGKNRGTIAWRNGRPPGEALYQATTVEALTWRPRQIQLIPERDGNDNIIVRKMKFKKGDNAKEIEWFDASLAYRFTKDGVAPIKMSENRSIWRDAGPLALLHEKGHGKDEMKTSYRRPKVVTQAFNVMTNSTKITISLYGMRTDGKMKFFEWIKSSLVIPSPLGCSSRSGYFIHQELDKAEQGAYFLRSNIRTLYPREGKGNKKALGNLAIRCEQNYWKKLEALFHPLMSAFAQLDPDALDDPALMMTTTSECQKNFPPIFSGPIFRGSSSLEDV